MPNTMTDTPNLTLYNSLTRQKEVFAAQDETRVTLYNCGPTVYSYAHIGNARAAIVADILFRVLRYKYGENHVLYARNITDVDDKIIAAAQAANVPMSEITEKYARIYNEDLAALGCLPPTFQPKATDHIQDMADIIIRLLDKHIAYEAKGHVLFDVTKKADYGKLSGRKLDDNLAGARVEVADYKHNPGDFVLWKPAKDDEPGWCQNESHEAYKVNWHHYSDRPFATAKGRPGWHIECSAMSKAKLGETLDIHAGGIDLKFPHHENEIAQSECASGKTFARFWVHNEFLNMGHEKMSKSLGNVRLIHDLLKKWDGEVIRLALLKAHYRSELIWSEELLKESKAQLDGWYRAIEVGHIDKAAGKAEADYLQTLLGDLDTPKAIAYLGAVARDVNIPQDQSDFIVMANLLGLVQKSPQAWFKGGLDAAHFDQRVADYDAARAQALAAKQSGDKAKMGALFKQSDAIRDELEAKGIIIETGSDGSTWRKA